MRTILEESVVIKAITGVLKKMGFRSIVSGIAVCANHCWPRHVMAGLLAALMFLPAITAFGADWIVTSASDDPADSGSFRYALANSASGDTIRFKIPGGGTITAATGSYPHSYLEVPWGKTLRFVNEGGDVSFRTYATSTPYITFKTGLDVDFTAQYVSGTGVAGRIGYYRSLASTTGSLNMDRFAGTIVQTTGGNSIGIYAENSMNIGEFAGTLDMSCRAANAVGLYTGYLNAGPHTITIQKLSGTISVVMNTSQGAFGIDGEDGVYIRDLSGRVHAEVLTSNDARGVALGTTSPTGVLRIDNLSGTVEAIAQYSATGLYAQYGVIQLGRLSGRVTAEATKWDRAFGIRSAGSINGGSADVPAIIESSGYVSAVSTAAGTGSSGLAVGISAGGPMNLLIAGTLKGIDGSGNGKGYAIRAGKWNNSLTDPAWINGTADNTITLDGATIVGKIDLGSGKNLFTLLGQQGKPLDASLIGVTDLVVGDGTKPTYWALDKGVTNAGDAGSGVFGQTTINANAKLAVNDSITSPVTVNPGGTLGGVGSITGNVQNYGTVSPGNSIGTLTVNGNYVQAPGSTLAIEVSSSGADKIAITGSATLNGGNVNPVPFGYLKADTNYTYTILQAQGGIAGSLAFINRPFFSGYLTRYPTQLDATFRRNSFGSVCETENQCSVGWAINNAYENGALPDITDALFSLDTVYQVYNAYNQMAGLVHTATPAVTFSVFNQYMDIQKTRMTGFVSGGPSSNLAAAPVMLTARTNTGNDANNSLLAAATSTSLSSSSSAPTWGLWVQGYGSLGERRASDASSRYDYDTAGLIVGFDKKITSSFLLGATVGYSYTRLDMKDLNEDAKLSSYQASLYGMFKRGSFYLSGIAAYGYNRYDTNRNIAFATISRSTSTDYTGHMLSGYVEGGYKLITKYVDIIPMVSFQGSYLSRGSFSENDAGNIGLDVGSDHYSSYIASLGVRLKKTYALTQGSLTPELRVRWDHEFSNDDHAFSTTFLGNPNYPFTIKGETPDRDRLAAGVGINWNIKNNVSLNLSYDGYFSGDTVQHAGMLGFRYGF